MKGILGRKAGMTQVFTENGKSLPVTVIEIQPNVVTAVMTKEKDGYVATQLAAFDRREKTSTKPVVGHLKKANTGAKYFIKEIRNMEGFELGAKVDGSIFTPGQLVDVSGTSKGHGFQGTIKRHNQKIGPKSHGGGGGSQPTRQTGSLGDMVSNRVFKGMTMPGHMGVDKVTVQNLEVIAYDAQLGAILVKGSIPGPRKGFVVVTEAIKGLPSKDGVKLVDVAAAKKKNELLEEAKKWGADVSTEMSVEEMQNAISAAKEAYEAEQKAKEAEEKAAKLHEQEEAAKEAAAAAHAEADKAKSAGDTEKAAELEKKAESLDHQVEVLEEKEKAAEAEAKAATVEAEAKEAAAEAAGVEVEVEEEDEKPAKEESKEGDK